MPYTAQFKEDIGWSDVYNYATVTNQSVNSTYGINMANFRRVCYTVIVPSLGSAGTLDGRLQASPYAAFNSGVVNLTGTNLTQITTSQTPSNNAIATVEVRGDQVTQQGSTLQYVRLNLTGGGNPITVVAIGQGKDPVQRPTALQSNINAAQGLSQQVVSNQ